MPRPKNLIVPPEHLGYHIGPVRIDDIAMLLACLSRVHIENMPDHHRALRLKLALLLHDAEPEHYKALVDTGAVLPLEGDLEPGEFVRFKKGVTTSIMQFKAK